MSRRIYRMRSATVRYVTGLMIYFDPHNLKNFIHIPLHTPFLFLIAPDDKPKIYQLRTPAEVSMFIDEYTNKELYYIEEGEIPYKWKRGVMRILNQI